MAEMSPLSPLTVRKRGAKVNAKQKKILLQFMADNPSIFLRKITTDFTVEHHKAFWQNMSAVLNIFGPPRKTVESWKKAWKDLKLRYRKVGIDLKEVLGTLKCENVVDTRMLLEKADQISTITRGRGDVEQILRETVLAGTDDSEYIPDMDIARDDKLLENDICNVKLENETTFAFNSENEDSKAGSKFDGSGEDLCEIAYEEIIESDLEDISDTDSTTNQDSVSKNKTDSTKRNGVLKNESDSEEESPKETPSKKLKLVLECKPTSAVPSTSRCQSREDSTNESNSLMSDLLAELRQHNKIQSEKLTLKKKHFEQKKRLLEQSLNAKKDIARAHIMLAKSVKTFVENISFDT